MGKPNYKNKAKQHKKNNQGQDKNESAAISTPEEQLAALIVEAEETSLMTIRVPITTKKTFIALCKANNTTASQVLRGYMQGMLDQYSKKNSLQKNQ